mgnify:CR=1 FL=1
MSAAPDTIQQHRAELRTLVNEQRQARRLLLTRDAFLALPYRILDDAKSQALTGKRNLDAAERMIRERTKEAVR